MSAVRIALWAILVIAVGLACVHFGKSQSLAPMPTVPQRMPLPHQLSTSRAKVANNARKVGSTPTTATAPVARLVDDYDALKIKADAGDKTAASELYRKVMACNRSARTQWTNMNSLTSFNVATSDPDLDPDVRAKFEAQVAKYADRINTVAQLCDGVTDAIVQSLPAVTLEAAKLGDVDARACYINRGPMADPSAVVNNPSLLADYRTDAEQLIADAMVQGDWRVVDMLQFAYSTRGWQVLSGVTGFDPLAVYRYQRLWRLGITDPGRAADYDQVLAASRTPFTPEEIAQADEWARSMFEQSFRNSGDPSATVPASWDACAVPPTPSATQ